MLFTLLTAVCLAQARNNSDSQQNNERLAYWDSMLFDGASRTNHPSEQPVAIPNTPARLPSVQDPKNAERERKREKLLERQRQYRDNATDQAKVAIAAVGASAAAGSVLANADKIFPTAGYLTGGILIGLGILGFCAMFNKNISGDLDRKMGFTLSSLFLGLGVASLWNPTVTAATIFMPVLLLGGVTSLVVGITAFMDYLRARNAQKQADSIPTAE